MIKLFQHNGCTRDERRIERIRKDSAFILISDFTVLLFSISLLLVMCFRPIHFRQIV